MGLVKNKLSVQLLVSAAMRMESDAVNPVFHLLVMVTDTSAVLHNNSSIFTREDAVKAAEISLDDIGMSSMTAFEANAASVPSSSTK